jgi:hypothetical protein
MPACLRWWLQTGLLAVAVSATAESVYLPLVGPPALRYEAPSAVRAVPAVPLAPLPASERKPAAVAEVKPAIPFAVPAATGETNHAIAATSENLSAREEAVDAASTNAVPMSFALPESETFTPQMFMKFFTGRPGTNGSGITIIAPLPFVPPVPSASPSSSASFQTVPPAKP